jgi:hypothetical protein
MAASVGGAGGCGTLKCLSVWTDACNSRFPHMLPVRFVFKALSIYVHGLKKGRTIGCHQAHFDAYSWLTVAVHT